MSNINENINLEEFIFDGEEAVEIQDLREIDEKDRENLLMAGIDVEERERSASFLHVNHSRAHCKSCEPGVEVLDVKEALERYNGLKDYYWKLVDPDKDEYTKAVYEKLHGGYFIKTEKGVKIKKIQSSHVCLSEKRKWGKMYTILLLWKRILSSILLLDVLLPMM